MAKKKRKRTKNDMYAVFPVHTWLSSLDSEYGRLCQDPEILLISLDWLLLDQRFSEIMTPSVDTQYISSVTVVVIFCLKSQFLSAEVQQS